MLKSYIRDWRARIRTLADSLALPSHAWIASAFRDFIPPDGDRAHMIAKLREDFRAFAQPMRELAAGRDPGRWLALTLIDRSERIHARKLGHRERKLHSYVEAGVQMRALAIFADWIATSLAETLPMDAIEVVDLMLEQEPDHRAALLVRGDLHLQRGQFDEAIASAKKALRVQSVCKTAEDLLFRAYRAKRATGSTDPEIAAADYDLSDRFCCIPFTHFSTFGEGETHACTCPGWVPYSIGNVFTAESADAIWNSDAAQEIRRSVIDGDFSYCSRTLCSFITARVLPAKAEITDPVVRRYIDEHVTRIDETPTMVQLNHDPTCNLACPSCRTDIVASKADEQDKYDRAAERVLLPLLRRVEGHAYITGGGEAFASRHFRSILKALNREEFPGLNLMLITNGQMPPARWGEFPNLPEMCDVVMVSIDAARAETYESLRRPGKWAPLMRHLEHLGGMRRDGVLRNLTLNFVVQQANFREIPEFVALSERIGADGVWFQKLANYGSYDSATFAVHEVTAPDHPEHAELLTILRDPRMHRPSINIDMLAGLLQTDWVAGERVRGFLDGRSSKGFS